MYKPNYKSKCCNAGVRPSFTEEKHTSTNYFICEKCDKPCDIKEEDNKMPA